MRRGRPTRPAGFEYEMDFFPADLQGEFRRIAELVGATALGDADFRRMSTAFRRLSDVMPQWAVQGQVHHPLTLMHSKHSHSHQGGCGQALADGIAATPACAAWRKGGGGVAHLYRSNPHDARLAVAKGGLPIIFDRPDAWQEG